MNQLATTEIYSTDALAFDRGRKVDFPKAPSRLTVFHSNYDWSETVRDRLDELCALKTGWDGYGAPPVSFVTAHFAMSMMEAIGSENTPTPQIVPGVDGDLQIEWHLDQGEIELHVKSPNDVVAWRSTEQAPVDGEEVPLRTDFKVVAEWLAQIVR